MAEIVVPANDATAVVVYSRRTFTHAIRSTTAAKLMSIGLKADDQTNFVQLFDETMKGPGDTIKYDLIPNVIGPGVLGDNPIAGQEQSWAALQDSFVINQQRQAELLKGRMSQQRVPYSMRDSGKVTLANWMKVIINTGMMNQLGGNTAQTDVSFCGLNAAIAPDSNHQIFAGTATTEATLTSAMPFSVNLIPLLVAKAQGTLAFPIKPVVIKGVEIAGVLFLHPLQVKALKVNFTAGEWADIYRAALTGGQITGNPIFTGAIGMYENCVIHQDAYVPYGDNTQNQIYDPVQALMVAAPTSLGAAATGTTSVARGIFVGAQAGAIAFGAADSMDGKPLRVRWYEELLDAGNQLRITAGMVWGFKKTRFPSTQDYATIVVSSWAA
jgi:N4-gp56 family major capsid protein